MMDRLRVLKTILWLFVGILAVATAARFIQGLGATTNLSDSTPWGLWIAFDVMGGVALAAGGFVLAAAVYIFHLDRFHRFVRPAILTAFLGYIAVAVGLLYDLGLPWRIWHPMIFPQHHSVLFEVAMCVMLYLTVLALEFAPVALEHPLFSHPFFQGALRILKKLTIVLVIAGIVLSTLHQSSLGSLFLIAPYRAHPLWYSPIIYVLFFVTAVGLGLMTVSMESLLSGYFFRHKIPANLLGQLGKAAAWVLGLYAVLRLGDLAVRGQLGHAFDGSWQANLFWLEIALSAFLPIALMAIPAVRASVPGLAVASASTIFGMLGYRFNLSIVAFARPEGVSYFPSWIEIAVSVGIVSSAALVFLFFVENLKVYEHEDEGGEAAAPRRSFVPWAASGLRSSWTADLRRYSAAFVVGAALAFGLLPSDAVHGPGYVESPVAAPLTLQGYQVKGAENRPDYFKLASLDLGAAPGGRKIVPLVMIDGNRDGNLVLFDHKEHEKRAGGVDSCGQCHHMNLPFDQNNSCHACHRDMYKATDIFAHDSHVAHLGGNASCRSCHDSSAGAKTRQSAAQCQECHSAMLAENSRIAPLAGGIAGFAPGYRDAMHGLCLPCHVEKEKRDIEESGAIHEILSRCDVCHGDAGAADLRSMPPFVKSGAAEDLARKAESIEPLAAARQAID